MALGLAEEPRLVASWHAADDGAQLDLDLERAMSTDSGPR